MATNFVSNNNMTSLMQAIKQAIQSVIYTLPTASASTKGGVKVASDSTLEMTGDYADVKLATANTRGVIKLGNYLSPNGSEGRVDVDKNGILGTIPTTLETMQTAINGKASQTDLTALTTRVGTAETNISGLRTRMSTAESNISSIQGVTSYETVNMTISNKDATVATIDRISCKHFGYVVMLYARVNVVNPQYINGAQLGQITTSGYKPQVKGYFQTSAVGAFIEIDTVGKIYLNCSDITQLGSSFYISATYLANSL